MGAWGIGLYSGDFAQDLRSTVRAVARLPYAPERLLEVLRASEARAAEDSSDSDHSVFWLVTADQFAQRGIDCPTARERALAIIADGSDLAAMRALGMDAKSLNKRGQALTELQARLMEPVNTAKKRPVLKAPQKLLLETGDVIAYPVCQGQSINPYTVGKDWPSVTQWKQDGWGVFVVAELGHVFDYLAWYRPLVISDAMEREPVMADVLAPRRWEIQHPGTLSARQAAAMQFKPVGRVTVAPDALDRWFPKRSSPVGRAVGDIGFDIGIDTKGKRALHEAHRAKHGYAPVRRMAALGEILAE